jgi:Mg2+/citrate symporter
MNKQEKTMAAMPEVVINIVTMEGAKLTLTAGDTLVLTLPYLPNKEQVEALTAHAAKSLPDGVKVLVLGGGVTVAAVTRAPS